MIQTPRDQAFDEVSNDGIMSHYTDLGCVELYRVKHPTHGDSLMIVPGTGEAATFLPIATLK